MLVCPLCLCLTWFYFWCLFILAKRSFETKYSTVGSPEWDSCLDLKPIPLQIQIMRGSRAISCRRPHTYWVNPDWGGRFWFPPTKNGKFTVISNGWWLHDAERAQTSSIYWSEAYTHLTHTLTLRLQINTWFTCRLCEPVQKAFFMSKRYEKYCKTALIKWTHAGWNLILKHITQSEDLDALTWAVTQSGSLSWVSCVCASDWRRTERCTRRAGNRSRCCLWFKSSTAVASISSSFYE